MKKQTGSRIIYTLSIIGFFGIFSTTMAKNPVLPLFVQSLGGDARVIGIISAISPLAGILFSFPIGMLSDRIGRKNLLVVSAAVFVAAPLLYIAVSNAWLLIPIRFFHGIATAILGPIAAAIICDQYPESKGEKLGLYSSVTLIGRTIAPIVGGAVISVFLMMHSSWSYKFVYVVCFIVTVPILFLALSIKEPSPKQEMKKLHVKDFAHALAEFFGQSRLMATGIVEMATYFVFGAFEAYIPVYLHEKHFAAYQIGIIFSVQVLSIALSKPLFGKLSDNIDRRIQILAGIIIIGASIASITLASHYVVILAVSIIFGIGMSLSTVATGTYVADITKKENLGSSMGALSSIMDMGHSSGPFVTGLVVSAISYQAGFMACMTVAFASAVFFAVFAFKKS